MTMLFRGKNMKTVRFLGWLIAANLGCFTTGFGAVFMSWYWLDMPNFADGLITLSAGCVLVGISLYHIIKQLKVWFW